ncbi:MAG: 23S rRNA (uracil(1939)-C(5))-methyltransferase RlmD [Clostridia bacterium]|nr:23S rRNA (uracil(1939)-C(5))-methyltransferase RlmD [Clostridia bacterium]
MGTRLLKNQVVTLETEGYSSDGSGVGRHDGFVVFVPQSARGDKLSVRIVKALSTHAYGRIEEILSPSPYRQASPCPVFSKCGGCDFMHITYEEELFLKAERVKDAMARIGGFSLPLSGIVPSPDVLRSRNKALFPVGLLCGCAVFGFYRARSHDIIPLSDCLINDERASKLAKAVAKWADDHGISVYDEYNNTGLLRNVFTRCSEGAVLLCIVAQSEKLPHTSELISRCREVCPSLCGVVLNINDKKTNVALGGRCVTLWGSPYLEDTVLGKTFRLSPLSFYQVNHRQSEALYEYALSLTDLDKTRDALDLYCGVGTITLALSSLCRKVYGAEIVPRAIDDARENAAVNCVTNAEFICADAGDAAKELSERGFSPYAVVCDPPRKGMDENALSALLSFNAERIVYIACDPASLARDAKYLCSRGYTLKEYKAFDMFPRTANCEVVALLARDFASR